MELFDFYPNPKELIANEVNTVKFLSEDSYMGGEHPQFSAAAKQVYSQLRNGLRSFRFQSYVNIRHAEIARGENKGTRYQNSAPNLQVVIGALIDLQDKKSYGNISYALILGRLRPSRTALLRKFHFDITTSLTRRQAHPRSHLQYCGSMVNPIMGELGYQEAQLKTLHMSLREPRIFFWPMSMALLIDLVFREFPNHKSEKFLKSRVWKNIIRENEKLLLHPFHKKCAEIINNQENQRKTLADEFYVA